MTEAAPNSDGLRRRVYRVVFESDTKAGRTFDLILIASILLSVFVVMLDSVASYRARWGEVFYALEWFFTILFTVEYFLRLYSVGQPLRYARSFFGAIDLLSVLPTYVSLLVPGTQYLLVLRLLRVLRIFRVLRIAQYVGESSMLTRALWNARRKIFVFLFTVVILSVIMGSFMYVLEGPEHGFESIPLSIYWAIVTMTTVGYGDISPGTGPGRFLASFIMILGYSIIAVPTGIVSVEMARVTRAGNDARMCGRCGLEGHEEDARYCRRCGEGMG